MTETPVPAAKPRRWLLVALVISLALNLAVAGFVAGLAFKGPPHRAGGEIGLWRYGAALPDPYRRDLAHGLREGREDWEAPRRALRAQRAALAEALTAEPYDPAAVARVLAAERDLLAALTDRGTRLLLAQIERMGPEERRAYAARLLEPRGGRRDRGR